MFQKTVLITVALLTSPLFGRDCTSNRRLFGTMDCAIAERAAKLIPDLVKRFAAKQTDLYFERISFSSVPYNSPLLVYTFETNQLSKKTFYQDKDAGPLKSKDVGGFTRQVHANVPSIAPNYELELDKDQTSFVMLPKKIEGRNSMIVIGVMFNQKLRSIASGRFVQAFFHVRDVINAYELADLPRLKEWPSFEKLNYGKCTCEQVAKCSGSVNERIVTYAYPFGIFTGPWKERCVEYQLMNKFFRSNDALQYKSLNECQAAIKEDVACADFPWVMD